MKYVVFLIIIFFSFKVFSQTTIRAVLRDSVRLQASMYFGKDHLKNDYYASSNVFKKNGTDGLFQYQNITLGILKKVCFTSPLQLLLFYEDFNSVVLLDNQLNETHRVDGNVFETPIKIEAFGLSGQNNIWLYDGFSQKISLYNLKTRAYKNISTPLNSKIKAYFSDFNTFYWIDEANNLFSISIFGKIKMLGFVDAFDAVQIVDDKTVILLKNNQLFYRNMVLQQEFEIEVVEKRLDNFFYSNEILSIFTHNRVSNYKIDLP